MKLLHFVNVAVLEDFISQLVLVQLKYEFFISELEDLFVRHDDQVYAVPSFIRYPCMAYSHTGTLTTCMFQLCLQCFTIWIRA